MRNFFFLLFTVCSLYLSATDKIQIPSTLPWTPFQFPGSGQSFFANDEISNVFPFELSLRNMVPTNSYFITFSRGTNGNRTLRSATGTIPLKYEIYANLSSRRVLKELGQSSNLSDFLIIKPDALTDTIEAGIYEFTVVLQPDKIFPKGDYTDIIQLNLYETPPNFAPKLLIAKKTRLLVTVPEFVEVSLGGSPWTGGLAPGQPTKHQLTFNPLETGASRTTNLQVRANQGFDLIIKNGDLRNTRQDGPRTLIPYQLTIAGNPVAEQTTKREYPNATPFGGISEEIVVKIGNITDQVPGTYQGLVQITARVRN